MFKVYEVTCDSSCGGNGYLGCFSTLELAERRAKGGGNWGEDGTIKVIWVKEEVDCE